MTFTSDQLKRYSRQTAVRGIGLAGQRRLAQGRVLVIGAGALGSAALMYLAAAGVGRLGIADYDRVELSNLERQIIHRTSRLGHLKTESAAETLHDINPDVDLVPMAMRITPENILSAIRDFDIVLDCTDHFENKLLINDACVIAGKPFVHAGVLETSGQIMTWVPGDFPCLRCLSGSAPVMGSDESCAAAGIVGAAVGVISSMQALEAIKYLLGKGELLTGRMLHFDGWSMTFSETAVPSHSPYCRVCGNAPDITDPAGHPEEYLLSCSGPV